MLSVEKCRIFYEVAKVENISKAAELLFVSQPAISKAIRELEAAAGCRLFVRSKRGVRLTTEGGIFYKYVEQGFAQLNNGEEILRRLTSREVGIVKIGISNTLCRYFLMPAIHQFHKKHSQIKIQIINRNSFDSMELLKKGKVDFVISSSIPEDPALIREKLLEIHDIFVAKDKREDLSGGIDLDELRNYPLMMLEKKTATREYIEAFLKENNMDLTPEIEIGSMDFLVEFAKIGLGISTVIREFVKEELQSREFYEIKTNPAIPARIIHLITMKNVPLSHASNAFIEVIKNSILP